MTPLKIYASREYLPENTLYTVMLYPFWGEARSDRRSPTGSRFDRFLRDGPMIFTVVDHLEQCDVAVLPAAWEHIRDNPAGVALASELAWRAHQVGCPLIVFYISDEADQVPLQAEVFRTSLFRSTQRSDEHAMPALASDILARQTNGRFIERKYLDRPVVGFCGYAPGMTSTAGIGSLGQRARARARVVAGRAHPDILVRARALRLLSRCDVIDTNFIIRDAFWGGAVTIGAPPNYDAMRHIRTAFAENLLNTDYALCARGAGNFSYRLYESLSAGRIPVFIDTDCVLPFESEIDWGSLMVWIDKDDLGQIGDRVLSFHRSLGPVGFCELQRECRLIWEKYLSPEGFFKTLSRTLRSAS